MQGSKQPPYSVLACLNLQHCQWPLQTNAAGVVANAGRVFTSGMMMKVGVEVSPTMYDHTPDMYRMRMPTDSLFCSRGQRSLFRAIWK